MSLKKSRRDNKLSPKYFGPYKVFQNLGTMAYPDFHVSCLKKVIGDMLPIQTILLELEKEEKNHI